MSLREFIIYGQTIQAPAYIHRTVDGWRIGAVGFSRSWTDATHGCNPAKSLEPAMRLLRGIMQEDIATLRSLFNGRVEIFRNERDGSIRAKAHIIASNKRDMEIPMFKYANLSPHLVGARFEIDDPALLDMVGKANLDQVFNLWCMELRRSFKHAWVRDILGYINRKLEGPDAAVESSRQLSLI